MGKAVLGGKRGRAVLRLRMMDEANEPIVCSGAKLTGSFLFYRLFSSDIFISSLLHPSFSLNSSLFFRTRMSCLVEGLR
jgi:hypothetical protein